MEFSFVGHDANERFEWFAKGLRSSFEARRHEWSEDPDQASLVVSFFPRERPRPFRRRSQAVFVVGVCEMETDDMVIEGYPVLVRSLSNMLIALGDADGQAPEAHFLTPERGHYHLAGNGDPSAYFDGVYQRLEPLATSTLVIENVFTPDLPESLWAGNEQTRSIGRAGRRLDEMDLLPAPFPLEQILPEKDRRHLKRIFGMGGLSYGNLSARHDDETFWMSASGVDKSKLEDIGRDILLVKDYDREQGAMIISVPPEVTPRRVSVDAIEHWMIYRTHPEVGAILHIHAWMDRIPSTEFNFPCGTYELGEAVAEIVDRAENPAHCVVGLKNHGLTITGESLDEIFDRIEGKIVKVVPMA